MMKRFFKIFICFLLIFSFYSTDIPVSYAEGTYEIDNDGKKKDKKDIYKDSGLPSSFKGAKYYDVAMPYNLSAYDVGGWCTDSFNKAYVYSKDKLQGIKISGNMTREWSTISYGKNNCPSLMSSAQWDVLTRGAGTDKATGMPTVEINGVKFFINVFQKFEYNCDTAKKWFGGFGGNGYLVDAVLTDGTVIHFIKGDSNAECHTNGSKGGDGSDGDGQEGDNKIHDYGKNYYKWWSYGSAKLMQYANIYGVSDCNVLELWSSSNSLGKFKKKYKIGNGDKDNRIAYFRMYNINVTEKDKIKPASNEVKKVSYKLGNVKLQNGKTTSSSKSSGNVSLSQTGFYEESHFTNVESLSEVDIELKKGEDLSKDQLKSITDWKNNIDYENEDSILKFIRVVVMFMGILFLVWMLFIYLCYWMDRINNFVDIDLLPTVTGGRLRVSPEEHECTFSPKNFVKGQPQTVNHRAILSICLIGIFFAVLVITGKLYGVINFIVRKILGWLGLV